MTPVTADLSDLLRRVKEAMGADRELDADLCIALKDFPLINVSWTGGPYREDLNDGWRARRGGCVEHPNWTDSYGRPIGAKAKPYTSTLDAVLDLASKFGFYIRSEPRFHIDGERVNYLSHALRPRWTDWRPDDEWFDRGEATHTNQTLSALAALLTALTTERDVG